MPNADPVVLIAENIAAIKAECTYRGHGSDAAEFSVGAVVVGGGYVYLGTLHGAEAEVKAQADAYVTLISGQVEAVAA